MKHTTFDITVPKSIIQYGLSKSDVQREIHEWSVIYLLVEEKITSEKATELLHMSKNQFLDLLQRKQIDYQDAKKLISSP